MKIRSLVFLTLAVILTGSILFSITQHVSFLDALYWALATSATVGYGDVIPHNLSGRLIAIGMMLFSVPLLGVMFAIITSHLSARRMKHTESVHKIISDLYKHHTGTDHDEAHESTKTT